ncbi:MAG TPA: four helix bundle protein [Nitrospirota bacterium]|nr:four helix bundle protein [Nitrospirota bacterium]
MFTRKFPNDELYGLASQFSVPANIAEGYERNHRKVYHVAENKRVEVCKDSPRTYRFTGLTPDPCPLFKE